MKGASLKMLESRKNGK